MILMKTSECRFINGTQPPSEQALLLLKLGKLQETLKGMIQIDPDELSLLAMAQFKEHREQILTMSKPELWHQSFMVGFLIGLKYGSQNIQPSYHDITSAKIIKKK